MIRIAGIAYKRAMGIRGLIVDCDFCPNWPNFVVVPNYSGKTFLAVPFAPLNSELLGPADADCYNGENWGDSSIFASLEEVKTSSADDRINVIADRMDVQVVLSGLHMNMINRGVGRGASVKRRRVSSSVPCPTRDRKTCT